MKPPGTIIPRSNGQHAVFTGAAGQVTVDTDRKTAVIHDGHTKGGFPLAHLSETPRLVATIAALRALADHVPDLVYVRGHNQSGDGGEGFFQWEPGSNAQDNGGMIIKPIAPAMVGRWRRQAEGVPVNVRWFGARGDGIADDRTAFEAVCDYLRSAGGGHIRIPFGTYRIGRRPSPRFTDHFAKEGAITLAGISAATIEFDRGAKLLMDNLNPITGLGDQFHGIVVRGPAANINILHPWIVWRQLPSGRSQGSGIVLYGYPDDNGHDPDGTGLLHHVRVVDSRVERAPQAGLVMSGCSDIMVTSHTAVGTLADGFHANACRRVIADTVVGIDTGDDVCAFVTYYDPKRIIGRQVGIDPYSQPALNEWCGNQSVVRTVIATGGQANGVRIAGGFGVCIETVQVEAKNCGAIVNSTISSEWTMLGARNCRIGVVQARRCGTGVLVQSENVGPQHPSAFWDFDVQIDAVTSWAAGNDGFHVMNAQGVRVGTIISQDCRVRLTRARRIRIGTLEVIGSGNNNVLLGASRDDPFGAGQSGTDLSIHFIRIADGEGLEVADVTGFTIERLRRGIAVDPLCSCGIVPRFLIHSVVVSRQGPPRSQEIPMQPYWC